MNNKKNNCPIYILSFMIPALVAGLAYLGANVYPGGPCTALIYDMRAQLLALYGYVHNGGPGYDTLLHNMSGGLGGGFWGTVALYISPLDLIYRFIPLEYIPDAIYFLTLIRFGLCGLFCSIFLNRTSDKLNSTLTVILSCCYGLMSYSFMYSMSPMWLDLVMILPLLALSLEKIIKGKKSIGFVLLMAYGIIADYYIAYMLVITLVLYFFYRIFEEGFSFSAIRVRTVRFLIHGLISCGLSSFVIVPVVMDFNRGKLMEDLSKSNHSIIKNSIVEVFKNFAPLSYESLDDITPPHIFCGTLVLVSAIIYFVFFKRNIKARLAGFLVLTIYFLSFVFGPLDRIWHGFRNPVGFSARYSFTFVFFMICFAARGLEILLTLHKKISEGLFRAIVFITSFYTVLELSFNGFYIISKHAVEKRYSNRDEYVRYCDSMTHILELAEADDSYDYSRICKDFRYSNFDGALFGYDGIERFSSSYNHSVSQLLSDLGYGTSNHTISEYGINPVTGSIFDMSYFISWLNDYSDYYERIGEYNGFGLYKNPDRMPLIYPVSIDSEPTGFTDDKFDNINTFLSDICPDDINSTVFIKQDFVSRRREAEEFYNPYTYAGCDYTFIPDKNGSYWFYSECLDDDIFNNVIQLADAADAFADFYVNGEKHYLYRNVEFSFINEIGHLEEGIPSVLTLDTSISDIGDTYIYRYDSGAFSDIVKSISEQAFVVDSIDKSGIKASGTLLKDSYLMITLPYENGYEIYIDGTKTEYTSYRDALILVPVNKGTHDIVIKYAAPGMRIGVVVSLISLVAFALYFAFRDGKIYKTIKR